MGGLPLAFLLLSLWWWLAPAAVLVAVLDKNVIYL
jgi:hypothetical protein